LDSLIPNCGAAEFPPPELGPNPLNPPKPPALPTLELPLCELLKLKPGLLKAPPLPNEFEFPKPSNPDAAGAEATWFHVPKGPAFEDDEGALKFPKLLTALLPAKPPLKTLPLEDETSLAAPKLNAVPDAANPMLDREAGASDTSIDPIRNALS